MKNKVKNALEISFLWVCVSFGIIVKHGKGFLAGACLTAIILLLTVILPLKDELSFTRDCLKTVQEIQVRTDLELGDKTRELNNVKNYLPKEAPRD